jgi:hypothetical protein
MAMLKMKKLTKKQIATGFKKAENFYGRMEKQWEKKIKGAKTLSVKKKLKHELSEIKRAKTKMKNHIKL